MAGHHPTDIGLLFVLPDGDVLVPTKSFKDVFDCTSSTGWMGQGLDRCGQFHVDVRRYCPCLPALTIAKQTDLSRVHSQFNVSYIPESESFRRAFLFLKFLLALEPPWTPPASPPSQWV